MFSTFCFLSMRHVRKTELVGDGILELYWQYTVKLIQNVEHTEYGKKVKVKLSLCFRWAPHHEGVLGECISNPVHKYNVEPY
jgi:hypothetical protein